MSIQAITSAAKAAGSQTALAKALGCTPQNVQWMCATGSVPAKHVLKIEAVTGVSRHLLRPDLYPDASQILDEMIPPDRVLGKCIDHAGNASSAGAAQGALFILRPSPSLDGVA